jgi:hypothetical protein
VINLWVEQVKSHLTTPNNNLSTQSMQRLSATTSLLTNHILDLCVYSLHPTKSGILTFEKNPTKNTILENRSNYLPKWSDLIFLAKLTSFGKQMRVLESFYCYTNLS